MSKIPQYSLTPDTMDAAAADFEKHGCLELLDFLTADKIDALAAQAAADTECESFKVGDGRFMSRVRIESEFNCCDLYGAPMLLMLLERLLGDEFVLSSYTCVRSFPGAAAQHRHRDHFGLFQHAIDCFAPSYAINLIVPLVALNAQTGTTRMWPESHRKPDIENSEGVTLYPALGSALLMDYRVLHEGTANTSNTVRPILSLGFARPWFLETNNFPNTNPIDISQQEFEKVDASLRRLFARRVQT